MSASLRREPGWSSSSYPRSARTFTTRALPLSLAITVALTVVSVIANAAAAGQRGLPPLGTQAATYQMLKLGAVTSVVMLILGILTAGGEYRHRTIVPVLLATPRRAPVFIVKVLVIALLGAVFSAAIFGLGLATATLTLSGYGIHHLPGQIGGLYVGTVISTVCFGMIGVALGALTRNTVGAIIAAIAWVMVVEQVILHALVPGIEKWLPVGAAVGLTTPPGMSSALSPAVAGLALAGYAIALLTVASRTSIRRDVG